MQGANKLKLLKRLQVHGAKCLKSTMRPLTNPLGGGHWLSHPLLITYIFVLVSFIHY